MFGIGPTELIVIAVVALVFVGPQRLPELMRQLGKFVVQTKRATTDIREAIDDTVKKSEQALAIDEQREALKEAVQLAKADISGKDQTRPQQAQRQAASPCKKTPATSTAEISSNVEGSARSTVAIDRIKPDEVDWEKDQDFYLPQVEKAPIDAATHKEGRGHVPDS